MVGDMRSKRKVYKNWVGLDKMGWKSLGEAMYEEEDLLKVLKIGEEKRRYFLPFSANPLFLNRNDGKNNDILANRKGEYFTSHRFPLWLVKLPRIVEEDRPDCRLR